MSMSKGHYGTLSEKDMEALLARRKKNDLQKQTKNNVKDPEREEV